MDRRNPHFRALALAAILAFALGVGLSTCGSGDTSSPAAAVESYFAAIADGDGEEACSIGTEEFQQAAVASVVGTPSEGETCEQTVANVPDEARELIEDVNVEATESASGEATVAVTVETEDAPPQPALFRVVRERDGWLIAGWAPEGTGATTG